MRLFEFGDQGWVPDWYQLHMRRYLAFFCRLFRYFKLWTPAFSQFVETTGARSFLECCSGSGEVLRLLIADLPAGVVEGRSFLLSDITVLPEFVDTVNAVPDSRARYCESPVDATRIPQALNIPRIFINSFHHFEPEDAKRIIRSSMENKQGVLILEYVRPSVLGFLSMVAGASMIPLTLPFVVTPRHLPLMVLFTYLIPIFPLMFFWDGVVSCLRVYGPTQISRLAAELDIRVRVSHSTQRSLLYPAGVLAISILPGHGEI